VLSARAVPRFLGERLPWARSQSFAIHGWVLRDCHGMRCIGRVVLTPSLHAITFVGGCVGMLPMHRICAASGQRYRYWQLARFTMRCAVRAVNAWLLPLARVVAIRDWVARSDDRVYACFDNTFALL
jgi:hypothetical protein